jgi:glucokinase
VSAARILVADIGGTSSRFGFFTAERGGAPVLRARLRLGTRAAGSFAGLLAGLRAAGFPLEPAAADIAVVAAAGPVIEGVFCAMPLAPWALDFSHATEEFGFRRWLLVNDFVAQAHAVRSPAGEAATPVLPGRAVRGAPVAVVGAGTGFGQAALLPDGRGGNLVVPSEGGHADFPLVGDAEGELGVFLRRQLGVERVTTATVVSGAGLGLVHWHLTGRRLSPEEVVAEVLPGTQSLAWSARFLGRACRIYVLQLAAFGGLYVAGGVAARSPALLAHAEFAREFHASAAMGERVRDVPVFHLADEESGLWGAAALAAQELGRQA